MPARVLAFPVPGGYAASYNLLDAVPKGEGSVRIDGGRGLWGAILVALLSTATRVHAQGCEPRVARIISVQGSVVVERSGAPRAQAAGLDDTVCPGDRVRVGALGRAAVQLANEAETPIRLDEGTTLIFPAPEPEKSFLLKLIEGVVHVLSRVPQTLTIETPLVAAYVEGTEFVLGVSKSEAELWVFEGQVRYSNPQGQLEVRSGEGALARPGQAPERRVMVKPREAVEWALYYPPLVDPRPESYPPALRAALSAYRANDLPGAFAALERVPARDRDGRYLLLRAGLLLSVGRVAKAEADLAEAERAEPKSGGAAALRSVIALVRDQKDDALRLAESGAGLDPNSPLPQAALSYAYQGRFEIEKALEHARRAVELAPEDALLWARVSELELSRGDLDAALEAAQKAETLSPALARTQTVLGFAYLTRIEIDKAKTAFERAIQGDPADPLPRLGLGLAKIRDGDLDEGTREIETAASLDPNNSLVRSYLGKAYYEQKRDGLASSEYEQAKLLDPKDPTPWFYDAIHKQTTNRPVEALQDLQKAIDLNDNRAVYRSKLLLDQDLAARSAALGRIYSDLGFEQLALVEGWKSLSTEPANYSAHRLLSDSYSSLPRHEIARVSELLQSQLLQPISITPVQPQLADSDLFLLGGLGPAEPSLNEFNPLFQRNRFSLLASGLAGSNETYGDEMVQSGLWDNLSYSLGQFHQETKGFRDNNDAELDTYNAFFQGRVAPNLSLQGEFRHREIEHGDLGVLFEPDIRRTFRSEANADRYRAGAHFTPTQGSDLIASFIYQDVDTLSGSTQPRTRRHSDGYIVETQYSYGGYSAFDVIAGGGYYSFDQRTRREEFSALRTTRHGNVYVHTLLHYPQSVTWDFGLSVDWFDDNLLGTFDSVNPKFGMLWNVTPHTLLRAAAFKVLKRSLIANQTLEPTQVAGFNQFFDDFEGTDSLRYGGESTSVLLLTSSAGSKISKRDLDVPSPDFVDDNWKESLYRGYLHWTPHPHWAASLDYVREEFTNLGQFAARDTETQIVSADISYFRPSGFFAKINASHLDQDVAIDERAVTDSAVFLDLSSGYRLPERRGIFQVTLQNLLDQDYHFEGEQNRRPTQFDSFPSFLPFPPELTIFFRFTIAL